jgi:hypothetical protein
LVGEELDDTEEPRGISTGENEELVDTVRDKEEGSEVSIGNDPVVVLATGFKREFP